MNAGGARRHGAGADLACIPGKRKFLRFMSGAVAAGCLVGPAVVGNRLSGSQELSSPGSDRRLREALAAMPKASNSPIAGSGGEHRRIRSDRGTAL